MLDALPVVTYTASAEPAEFVLVDGAVEQLTGYPKEDFLDDYSLSSRVLHPDDRAHALSQYESGLAEGKTFEIEFRIIHRNGGVRWVHTCVVPELNEAGQLLLHHGVITDTTARKDAEARSHRLLTAIENAGEGVGVWSHNWKLEYGNTALVNLLGSQSIQHALRIRDDTHPSTTQAAMTLEEVTEQLQQAGHWRGRLVIPQEDGKHLICDATFSRVGPADGAQLIVGNLRDQTAQENYIQQIRSLSLSNEELLEEERKRISRELHDELGQILTAMKINLKWIGNAVADAPAPAVERLQECQDLTQRMVDGVRDMVRSLRPAVLTEGTLEDALAAMVGDFRANTGVGCLLTSRIEKVQVSPQLAGVIYRVVQEALTNVARHAQASFCRVRLHSEGDHVILSVEDNGRGLDPEDLVTGQSKGLIGMRERVEAVGGTLKVSACRGQGLCVVAELPVSPVEGGSTLS
jgi:PAS domain S-box-containing protein